jgi:hypothetical protein
MHTQMSYDEYPELFSLISRRTNDFNQGRQSIRDLIGESQTFILRYFTMLPQIDFTIAKLYYIERLSQDQISDILGITQAAVSRRLKFVLIRVKFLLKMPTLSPIQVRTDFEMLFPEELHEFAYFFYFESAQNRVKFFIKTSQSGAANKFARVNSYLEKLVSLDDATIVNDLEMQKKKYLALVYLEYFRFTRLKSNIITFLFKRFDPIRARSLIPGPSILPAPESAYNLVGISKP